MTEMTTRDDGMSSVLSLLDLEIELEESVKAYLASAYLGLYNGDLIGAKSHLAGTLEKMKYPPLVTVCRVNLLKSTVDDVYHDLKASLSQSQSTLFVAKHEVFEDVICIKDASLTSMIPRLSTFSIPPPTNDNHLPSFPTWPDRKADGWPVHAKVVICDRLCGEAILRGADAFCPGIIASDGNVHRGDRVAVYAHIRKGKEKKLTRGQTLQNFPRGGACVFVGVGYAVLDRKEIFSAQDGLGVKMSRKAAECVGTCVPSLNGVLAESMMLQNLPSIAVGHALNPQQGETILDMCAAPGGKTAHVASLVRNNACIVCGDRSRKKVLALKSLLHDRLGASCVTPLVWNATKCVERQKGNRRTVQEVIASATPSKEDGLLEIKGFYPESFDRILLDPPCSALGLRPKLAVDQTSIEQLQKHADYQKKFVSEAVDLLKPGGTLTYSTCTFHVGENEAMVRYILDKYPVLDLVPINMPVGLPGLPGVGLSDDERRMVRRFDPTNENEDCMGFFVAKFVKKLKP